jgi:drug/metabolite transporter (DMT)-like permease
MLRGIGDQLAGQIACLIGAALYAGAAIYGKRFGHISALATAAGTMIWAAVVLVPTAFLVEKPWTLKPSNTAIGATIMLSVLCTGVALQIYFRLVRTIGSMGVASQSYLRAGIGVVLGVAFLGESIGLSSGAGLLVTIIGVALINWP